MYGKGRCNIPVHTAGLHRHGTLLSTDRVKSELPDCLLHAGFYRLYRGKQYRSFSVEMEAVRSSAQTSSDEDSAAAADGTTEMTSARTSNKIRHLTLIIIALLHYGTFKVGR